MVFYYAINSAIKGGGIVDKHNRRRAARTISNIIMDPANFSKMGVCGKLRR